MELWRQQPDWLVEGRVGGEEFTNRYKRFVGEGGRHCWLKEVSVGCGS